jgi:hypothetical protein
MLWGQNVKRFTDHANLMSDALGLASDRVYQWRLLLEEYGPKIVYIKGIHNTIADTVLRLEYDPSVNRTAESFYMTKVGNSRSRQRQNWMKVLTNWCKLDLDTDKLDIDLNTNKHDDWNLVFAHHKEEDKVYPLTTIEIAEAQHKDQKLKVKFKKIAKKPKKDTYFQLIENTEVLRKNGKLIIPKSLRHRAVSWYCHYLQHPGHLQLEKDDEISDVLERYA